MDADFPKLEEKVLKQWREQKTFEKSLERRKKSPRFVFYEGPPTANAGPGLHHVLSRVFKDVICRYKTMRGFLVERKAGWDTHGLPVELQIEKKLGLNSKKDIEEKYGIAKFNKQCKESVWEYKKEWEQLTERIGFWLDMEHPYITYETEYIETLWFIIKQFWQKGLLYKDYKVVPYCPRCGTPLSSHEMAQGYKTVKDRAVYVKFKVQTRELAWLAGDAARRDTYILAWTTTPWTLPGNVALAVGKDIKYSAVEHENVNYIVAQRLVSKVFGGDEMKGRYKNLGGVTGKQLEDLKYEPLFDSLKSQPEKEHYVALGDFVSTEEGTGIVHTAVMYGEDDYELGKRLGLPKRHTVDEEGKFNELVPQCKGMFVKDAEPLIIEDLRQRGLLYKEEPYEHEYPFCWRCDTPLLYYAKDSWFVNMQKVKKELIANNQSINWIPPHVKTGRMGEWLAEVKDWAFSRERYWGTPLPIWECKNCGSREVVGSLDELRKHTRSSNIYYILRHGHSERQKLGILSSWPEKKPLPLTTKGRRQIRILAKRLKRKQIDLIVCSDILRAKETAQIIADELGLKVEYDKRLREADMGTLNGRPLEEFGAYFAKEGETELEHYLRRFHEGPSKGETYVQVQKRVFSLMKELEKRHRAKRILLVSHELPLTLLEGLARGYSREELVRFRMKNAIDVGGLRPLSFVHLPYNDEMELDFHRLYIDEVEFSCTKCSNGQMKRVSDVVDVWFDSGAMPFAQGHWPFTKNSKETLRDVRQGSEIRNSKLAPPVLYPADYITEAIDQTRGWFYTLLAVATLLGFKAPYKNVISLGHVLDEKGEKMSKSKGNVVNPWDMIAKYGVDTLRWYFYTLNHPWDSKAFVERDVRQAMRKFMLTLWNCYAFYETYGQKIKNQKSKMTLRGVESSTIKITDQSSNILDRWIISRLNSVTKEITKRFDEYDITEAARTIEGFVIGDLSLWYIRRSRQRFQNPQSKKELLEANRVLGYVLLETSKLVAPFIPFMSEHIYRELGGEGSVHWQDWPSFSARGVDTRDNPAIDKRLEKEMGWIRELVARGLSERAKVGIKVRQPLQKLKVKSEKFKVKEEFVELIRDELNVKEVVFDKNLETEVELDTAITPVLRQEGLLREIVRYIQDMRKKAGCSPRESASLWYECGNELKEVLLRNERRVRGATGLRKLQKRDSSKRGFDREEEFVLDGEKIWLGIQREVE